MGASASNLSTQSSSRSVTEFDVFLTPEALAINKARLDHLASLELDLSKKTVLEVGAGIGCILDSFKRGDVKFFVPTETRTM